MKLKLKIIGLLRFSVLTPTYYSERFADLDTLRAHLFSQDRMALRFQLFETLVLPSLRRQRDQDFDLVVLTSQEMPKVYLDRLKHLTDPLENVHLRAVEVDRHYQLIKAGYASVTGEDESHRVLFRVDDDDALHLEYIARLRSVARKLITLQPPEQPQCISFNRGFCLDVTSAQPELFDTCERAPISAGTALIAPVGYRRNPYRYNHRHLAQYYPTYADRQPFSFIRTIHGDNKSTPTQAGLTRQLSEPEIAKALETHFGLSLDDLLRLGAWAKGPQFPPQVL